MHLTEPSREVAIARIEELKYLERVASTRPAEEVSVVERPSPAIAFTDHFEDWRRPPSFPNQR